MYSGINDFKKGYQPRCNIVKDEQGDLVADSHSADEKSRCLGEIKIGFDRAFGATSSWVIDDYWPRKTETGGGGGVIFNTSRALLRGGRAIEQVRLKEITTPEKFYAFIKFDLGICRRPCTQTFTNQRVASLQIVIF